MSATNQPTANPSPTKSEPDKGPAGLPTTPANQLVALYDELAEVVALNQFLYDAFVNITSESGSWVESRAANGLDITCRWASQRQCELLRRIRALIKGA